MRLLALELSDFRGFYGLHQIAFASGDKRHVTVFHGENGAGKTNLLNAIHWCITGKFTPRFQDNRLLVNKEAIKEGRRECFVELLFRDEESSGGKQYRVRRSATNDKQTNFEVYEIDKGNSRPIERGESLLKMLLPPGLISWFFFDAEAIGSLELSGSEEFKRGLRKTLGFELVDQLLRDLEQVQARLRREVAAQSNDKQLKSYQSDMDNIDHVMPGLEELVGGMRTQLKQANSEHEEVRAELGRLPQAEPIEKQRNLEEQKKKRLQAEHAILSAKAITLIGQAAPDLVLSDLTKMLEGKLADKEVKGKLPAPYSVQLVEDIFEQKTCICGRPVLKGSDEARKISDLLQFASTSAINQRIAKVRYLIKDIERQCSIFPVEISDLRNRISKVDQDISNCEEQIKECTKQLQGIKIDEIQKLEQRRVKLLQAVISLSNQLGKKEEIIEQNKRKYKELKVLHENASKKLKISKKLQSETDKATKLIGYIKNSLIDQEQRALKILSLELNQVLEKYLVKHYRAIINPSNYAVQLVDTEGRNVGHSTGEGLVLKFAFIATVVALAAKKTQEKIHWMADPTIAPLVLDAPFSALDPEYQGSVAKNLALQTTQLVLLLKSDAWGPKVAEALEPLVGKRYLIVSHESGPQGAKPVKSISLNGKAYLLNCYNAERTESTLDEVAV